MALKINFWISNLKNKSHHFVTLSENKTTLPKTLYPDSPGHVQIPGTFQVFKAWWTPWNKPSSKSVFWVQYDQYDVCLLHKTSDTHSVHLPLFCCDGERRRGRGGLNHWTFYWIFKKRGELQLLHKNKLKIWNIS